MMRILGLCIVLFTIYYVCSRSVSQRKRRERVIAELYSLVCHLYDGISAYMRPIGEVLRGYPWAELSSYGFPDVLLDGRAALYDCGLSETVGEECAEVVIPLFEKLGSHVYSEELARLGSARERLGALLSAEREGVGRASRLTVTLGLSASLAIIILVI